MAQNVTIAGASYTDVPAVALPVVGGGTAVFPDTSGDTVTAAGLQQGLTAHDASGALITGTAVIGGGALAILVTAPAGSTVTAAKDGSTYAGVEDAQNPGSYTVSIPEYGTYTVTAALGTWSDSESLLLEAPEVEMSPWEQLVNYTMLYDGTLGESGEDGANVCKAVTGGWVSARSDSYKSTLAFRSNAIVTTVSGNAGGGMGASSVNKIPLAGYSRAFSAADYRVAQLVSDSSEPVGRIAFTSSIDASYGRYAGTVITQRIVSLAHAAGTYRENAVHAFSSEDAGYCSIYTQNAYGNSGVSIYMTALAYPDDWETLCTLAGVETPETMETLLSDSDSLAVILGNRAAVGFMVRQCTGDFMVTAVTSDTFLAAYQASPWKTVIDANEHWAKFLQIVA